jgi:hypothetical protein
MYISFLAGFLVGIIFTVGGLWLAFSWYSKVANDYDDPYIHGKYDDTEDFYSNEIKLITSKKELYEKS